MERCIIHSDLNSFYASVECIKRPEISSMPVIVCGNPTLRHGIVLAKNAKAKKCGITTGNTIGECSRKSNNLVSIHTEYDDYIASSKKIYTIYRRYSDYVENFGIDECWLDITNIQGKDKGIGVSREIMEDIKKETGLTVSLGVSYNKTFAKLGSHLAGINELISITRENFRKTIWNVPVKHLMFSGNATTKKLRSINIFTIGDLARADKTAIKNLLGVNGLNLMDRANGIDNTPVNHYLKKRIHKSISSGITMPIDLTTKERVTHLIFCLTEELTYRMRKYDYRGNTVHISVKSPELKTIRYSSVMPYHTCSTERISRTAISLYDANSCRHPKIRALTVTVDGIIAGQLQLNLAAVDSLKEELLEHTIDDINRRFDTGVFRASKLVLTPVTDYFSKHSGLHKVAFSQNVSKID